MRCTLSPLANTPLCYRALSGEQIDSLFEAARWAPSASNAQPWLFITARKPASLQTARALLKETNQRWALRAPLLVFVYARKRDSQTGRPLRTGAPGRQGVPERSQARARVRIRGSLSALRRMRLQKADATYGERVEQGLGSEIRKLQAGPGHRVEARLSEPAGAA
jgi:nitroreductase